MKLSKITLLILTCTLSTASTSAEDPSISASARKDLNTQLISATEKGSINTVNTLIAAGADVDAGYGLPVLMIAANRGYTEIVKALIAAGANVNVNTGSCRTALILATQKGFTEIVEILIDMDADLNAKTWQGYTALKLLEVT